MQIIAHRGASGAAPENTLPAFRLAWAYGADGIELDVHLSRDGRIMVHHDATLRGDNGADLTLAATDSATLRRFDVARGRVTASAVAAMPFLEEVLGTVPPGKEIWIEIKCGVEIVPRLAAILNHPGSPAGVVLISFEPFVLHACRAAMPTIPCYWIIADTAQDAAGSVMASIEPARRWGFAGLDPDFRLLNVDFVAAAHAAGLRLNTWTVNDPAVARALNALGLEAITTDYPDLILGSLQGRES
jgi:glycerophosphoryl diester phosphodiesterase